LNKSTSILIWGLQCFNLWLGACPEGHVVQHTVVSLTCKHAPLTASVEAYRPARLA
jgi:hypothetical protein